MEGRRRYRPNLIRYVLLTLIVLLAFAVYNGLNLRFYHNYLITSSVLLGVVVIALAVLRSDAKDRGIWH